MKQKSGLSSVMSAFSGTIIVLSVILLDNILGNVHQFMGDATTMDEYYIRVMAYNLPKSVFDWTPYILILLYGATRKRVYFTIPDKLMAFLGLFFAIINTTDWLTNGNWRPVWADWVVFGFIMSILLYFRYIIWKVSRT